MQKIKERGKKFLRLDQILKITGKVFTSQVGRLSDGTGDNFDPEGMEIDRLVQWLFFFQ